MNYFHCRVCGKLNDLDSDFCDIYHMRYWVESTTAFHKWLVRGTPLLDYVPSEEWEFNFQPLEQGGALP